MHQSANIPQVDQQPEADSCFHCGLPVAAVDKGRYSASIDGTLRMMCCPGCALVAETIAGRGLSAYYQWRESTAPALAEGDGAIEDLSIYDDPLMQSRFVRELANGHREATLLLEDIRCSACAWLIEQTLQGIAGLARVSVNYADHRATVAWNPDVVKLSAVLRMVRQVGYRASPYDAGRLAHAQEDERRTSLWRLFVAGFGMMQVMMYAIPTYIADEGTMTSDAEQLMRWAGLILTLPVLLYSAAPFFKGAWADLRHRRAGMDVPVALGVAVAFLASTWSTLAGGGSVYFDSVSMFMFLLLGGRHLELLARQRAARPLQHLARVMPEVAHRVRDLDSLDTESVAVARLQPGELVLVRPGETIPADGSGLSAAQVSEAVITGESRLVHKQAGGRLIAGAVNLGSAFVMRVTGIGAETVLSSIVSLVDRAVAERPPMAELARRAAAVFVAGVLVTALLAVLVWLRIDPDRALWIAVSLLIVTCPCALSLATPAALSVATGELAASGVVAARGHTIESLGAATDFIFDKTGTLTFGRMQLLETLTFGPLGAAECARIAAAMERSSEHPLASAFCSAVATAAGTKAASLGVSAICNEAGQGIQALVDGRTHRIGQAAYVSGLHGRPVPVAWLHSRHTVVWVGDEQGWLAAFRLGDGLRDGAQALVEDLGRMGRKVHLLSGDDASAVEEVARQLGIAHVRGGADPAGKLAYVRQLQKGGARVAMVGDGINDAPVLSQADVSVAMGGGSNLAQLQSDAVLLSESLLPLARAVRLALRTRRVLRQNLAWALAYNLVAVPLAFAGLVTPLLAGIGMSASSLIVVLNAQRLRLREQAPEGRA
jgi:Cu2+-exporting ATPase